MLRNATLRRVVASFFLLELVGSLAAPSLSYALMGPGQPEFTSYESAGSSDMVSLSTGDMTYNVPVLELPGPETTFSLPLTYRAGIRLEQEASWVGLGWSMNPGAIVRNVNGYPDDSGGELAVSSYTDPGHHGWYGGLPGVLQLGWDSETGHSGSASLLGLVNASWSGGRLEEGDVIGIGADRTNGAGVVNPAAFVGAMVTIATVGIGTAISAGAKIALQAGGAVVAGVGVAALGKQGPSGGGFLKPTINKDHTWFRTNYWVFVNDTTKEAMFGSLYFDKMQQNTSMAGEFGSPNYYGPDIYDGLANYQAGQSRKAYKFDYTRESSDQGNFALETAADMQQAKRPDQSYRETALNPVSIAHDDYTVMGPGISGTIRPQRLDMGTLAYPRQMLRRHDKYLLTPWQSYKVPFRYENSAANTYTYNTNASENSTTTPAAVDASQWSNHKLILTDPKLYDATVRMEANRKGLTDQRLEQGKQIYWYSNREISAAYDPSVTASPILEHAKMPLNEAIDRKVFDGYNRITVPPAAPWLPPTYTYEARYKTVTDYSNNKFRALRPANGIGAFVVVAEDGTTYHYSLPVYQLREYGKSTPLDPNNKGVATNSRGSRNPSVFSYATAWLLTAITGPDYIDQGDIGVVDDQDVGTWVKFTYGKFSSQYKWRQPYIGEEGNPSAPSATSFQEGDKETYYLNSIATRTHTALFIKSIRQDGRGHYNPSVTTDAASNLGIIESTPASSLRLDEIIVLSNKDLSAIKASTGFSEDTNTNANSGNMLLGTGDSFKEVLDKRDIEAQSSIRPALNQKALKRIVFNYSYRLCPGASNSFASATAPPAMPTTYTATSRLGKLTLESIATYGPNSVKLIPDFRFDYGYNPSYHPDKWDAFGMYSRNATSYISATNRKPSEDFAQASEDGAAWSLTKITSPLGAVTDITYERDQYASISDVGNELYQLVDQGTGAPSGTLVGNSYVDLTQYFKPGDVIWAKIQLIQNYYGYETPTNGQSMSIGPIACSTPYGANVTITAVTPNSITVANPPAPASYDPSQCMPADNNFYTYQVTGTEYGGCNFMVGIPFTRNGGDIRVATVTTQDEANHTYTIKYKYNNNFVDTRNSSGVLSKEPEYISQEHFWFYDSFDYPSTPVMYGQTTVLRGNFTTADDIDQREEYAFYTASSAMVKQSINQTNEFALNNWSIPNMVSPITFSQRSNSITVDIGLLGQPKSIRKYNKRGTQEFSTVFNYATSLPNADGIANQGVFTEGAVTSEFLDAFPEEDEPGYKPRYNINWTTKKYLPTTLLGATTTTNNIAATTTNKLYDFYTGVVLETSLRNSLGDSYRSQTVPAYTLYPGMGPKSESMANKHMLTQTAAVYTYKENGTASPSVLTAGIQTWKNDWTNYRIYDSGSDSYKADPNANVPIWRQHRTYLWQSPRLNSDGTYASFVPYKWDQSKQSPNWLNVGEVTLYDHYSRPLESKDVNGKYATQKAGYDQSQVLAGAGNARYTEIAYSGAEDVLTTGASTGHFGGEVRDGGRQSSDQYHTGQYSSLLTPASSNAATAQGFTYKALVGDANDLSVNRTYRASVWVYNSDVASSPSNGARLYVTLNGTTVKEVGITANNKRAGNWYLLDFYVDLPASATGQQLVVGCRNAGSANVYVDDFRFHPLDAPLQANVYDPATRQLTYSLDNDNLFTHYQYDAAGKVVKVYKEVLTTAGSTALAERLIKESSYNYAQMRTPNWLDLGTACATNSAGQTTGYLAHTYQDVNTESPTYNQIRTEYSATPAASCPATACSGFARWNNTTQSCETPVQTLIDCYTDNNKHFGVYVYIYQSDGSCYKQPGAIDCYQFNKIQPNWQTLCP